jgi:hypothetical protein
MTVTADRNKKNNSLNYRYKIMRDFKNVQTLHTRQE